MANNFLNKIARNVSADLTAPTVVYAPAVSKKTIVIELDVANSSTAAQTISVLIDDFSAKGAAVAMANATAVASNVITAAAAHGLIVNDRVQFSDVTGFTGSTVLATKVYFVQSVPAVTTFTLATTPSATAAMTVTGTTVTATSLNELIYAYIVREAPVPIGGALKVISGQKMVLEGQDSLLVTASTANSIDAIASILEDVS
jgi:hypothetical protein